MSQPTRRVVEFSYMRLIGLCNIVDGFVMVFTPWRPRLGLRSATGLARYRGRHLTRKEET